MSSTTLSSPTIASSTASASATCVSVTPDKNGYVPPGSCNSIYDYYPSFGAAICFSVLFGLILGMHVFQAAKFKKRFCWVIIMAAVWETGSFVLRTISTRHQQNQSIYTASFLLVTLAPILVNAFVYMVLGRLVHYFLPSQKIFHVKASRFSTYFVWLDIISFLVQLIGALILSQTDAKTSTIFLGIHIYMGGIGLQQFFILVFSGLAISFHREMLHLSKTGVIVKQGWQKMIIVVYIVLALISVRILYRLIEYSRGVNANNPLPFHEAYFYVLDALPMLFATSLLCLVHPGHMLIGPESEFPKLSRKQKKAAKAAKKAEKMAAKSGMKPSETELSRLAQGTDLEDGYSAPAQQVSYYSPVAGHEDHQPYNGSGMYSNHV